MQNSSSSEPVWPVQRSLTDSPRQDIETCSSSSKRIDLPNTEAGKMQVCFANMPAILTPQRSPDVVSTSIERSTNESKTLPHFTQRAPLAGGRGPELFLWDIGREQPSVSTKILGRNEVGSPQWSTRLFCAGDGLRDAQSLCHQLINGSGATLHSRAVSRN